MNWRTKRAMVKKNDVLHHALEELIAQAQERVELVQAVIDALGMSEHDSFELCFDDVLDMFGYDIDKMSAHEFYEFRQFVKKCYYGPSHTRIEADNDLFRAKENLEAFCAGVWGQIRLGYATR